MTTESRAELIEPSRYLPRPIGKPADIAAGWPPECPFATGFSDSFPMTARPPEEAKMAMLSTFCLQPISPSLPGAPSLCGEVGRILRRQIRAFFDPYRPEQHYMRGAGPKWREKHQANATAHASRLMVREFRPTNALPPSPGSPLDSIGRAACG